MTGNFRRLGAWLAVFGLLLQTGLGAAHSARHFDHLVGHLAFSVGTSAAVAASADPGSPTPDAPPSADFDHCAIGLGLAAAGNGVLPPADAVPLPPVRERARLESEPQAIAAAFARHLLPPARAPPVIAISA
jgi:hypothetical protein